MEDLIISAIYEKEETSPKQAPDFREKALTVLHYATTGFMQEFFSYGRPLGGHLLPSRG